MEQPKAILATKGTWNTNKPGRITHFVVYGDEVWGANIVPSTAMLRDVTGRLWDIIGPSTHTTPRGEEIPAVDLRLVEDAG